MYNRVFLVGNLARDPEVRYTPAGIAVARLTLAVNRPKKRDGSEPEADFIPVVAWRRLAEICGEYLKKGRPVAVEGRLQVRTFTGRDGKARTIAEVVLDNMQMLGKKMEDQGKMKEDKGNKAVGDSDDLTHEEAPF